MRSSRACISSLTIRPDAIAQKALRVNLSDLAAKGAAPAGFLLSLALPESCSMTSTTPGSPAFARGLAADARTL